MRKKYFDAYIKHIYCSNFYIFLHFTKLFYYSRSLVEV